MLLAQGFSCAPPALALKCHSQWILSNATPFPASARALDASHQVWLAAWVPDRDVSFVEDVDAHIEAAFDPDWIGKDPIEDMIES